MEVRDDGFPVSYWWRVLPSENINWKHPLGKVKIEEFPPEIISAKDRRPDRLYCSGKGPDSLVEDHYRGKNITPTKIG